MSNTEYIVHDNKEYPKMDNKYPLSHQYNIWFHQINNRDWKPSSYKLLHTFSDIKSFFDFYQRHPNPSTGMYFVMKDPIVPTWEDMHNQEGGCWSFKLDRSNAIESWTHLSMAFIGNTLAKNRSDLSLINGISLTLRKYNSIIKIWNNDRRKSQVKNFIKDDLKHLKLGEVIYQKHKGRE
jgi:hypothetical protein